jgi:hypothetical protein
MLMKKFISIILLTCFSIFIIFFPLKDKDVLGATTRGLEGAESFKGIIASTKNQFKLAYGKEVTDTDGLIAFGNELSNGNAISIWDAVFDNDDIVGNTFSKDRILADGSYILFQTSKDAENQTDTLILYDINGDTLETVTDRSIDFALLDQMDKIKNDNILEDDFKHTVSKAVFMDKLSIKIILRNDKLQLIGLSTILSTTPTPTSNIKVTKVNKISVKTITLNKSSISLKQGGKLQLIATITPQNVTDPSVRWISDNKGVASVDADGNITAIKAGKAKITVTSVDGKKTAICQVTVTGSPVAKDSKTSKTSNGTGGFNYKVGQTVNLYCAAAYGTLEWVSTNTEIVRISSTYQQNCTINCLKAGTATIIAYVHSSELMYDPVLKIMIRQPKTEDYVHYNINISK